MAQSSGPGELLELEEDRRLATLVSGWDFNRGRGFEQAIFSRFKTSVHYPASSSKGAFFLLAVFHRFTFRLTPESVSLALHACLGGSPSGFHVKYVNDRHFCFSVASKAVGFAVSDLKRITTSSFDVYFHLWRDGGDDWSKEFKKWRREEVDSWQLISRHRSSSKRVSFARVLNQPLPSKKSSPPELRDRIKVGSFFLDISTPSSSFPAFFSNSNFRSKAKVKKAIPTGTVFSRIKSSLFQARDSRELSLLDDSRARARMHVDLFCSRCLSEGHQASSCASDVRCLWCFGYGHKKSSCFRRRANRFTQWKAKNAIMTPAMAALEPHAEVTPRTNGQVNTGDKEMGGTMSSSHKEVFPSLGVLGSPSPSFTVSDPSISPSSEIMVNFVVNPEPFIPPAMVIEDGGPQRRVRREVFIRGGVSKAHEDCTIAVVNDNLSVAERHQLLHDITNYVVAQLQLNVRFFALHPHGVGILRLRNACQRDALITLNPHFIGQRQVTFYPHDKVPINFRRMSFTVKCWIILLGYPLDFKDATTLVEVCTPFARVLHWNSEDSSMSRVLLRVLVEDRREIPRDVVIKMGRESDGEGRSWTVPIYIFNSEILPVGPFDEEDPPDNNEDPHPFHGPILPGEQQQVAMVADQYMEEILQQNPYPVVAVPDQGSSLVPLARNVEGRSVVVTLDPEECKARRLNKRSPSFSLSQLIIPGSCIIKAILKADGSISDCLVVLPGGVELSVVLPKGIQKALICPRSNLNNGEVADNSLTLHEKSTLLKPIWTDRNKKITRVYF
jgi:hypothetical protein